MFETPVRFSADENNGMAELQSDHVREIIHKVCRRKTFSTVQPIYLNGKWRLAVPGVETTYYLNRLRTTSRASENTKDDATQYIINTPHIDDGQAFGTFKDIKSKNTKHSVINKNWPQRMKNHCLYLTTERLHETEAYDLWLRTSAGQLRTFEDFLCFGEKVFGDCVEEIDDVFSSDVSSSYKKDGPYSSSRLSFEDGDEKV